MRVLVTGATGFVGRHLIRSLERPVVLSRQPERARKALPGAEVHGWDPLAGPPSIKVFEGVDAVINLAGESIAEGRWTKAKKQRIRDSRVIGTQNLVSGLEAATQRPRVLVSTSAIGIYGSRGDNVLDESTAPGFDFLADVCREWEAAAAKAQELGMRVVAPRLGMVLGPDGGALKKMILPFKLGLGGRLGTGRQWMSWIHVDDVVGLLLYAAEHGELAGPMNLTAPQPVTNRDFTKTLAETVHRPAIFPVPALALRVLLGEVAKLLLLASQRVLPEVAMRHGYAFQYPELRKALRACLGKDEHPKAAGK